MTIQKLLLITVVFGLLVPRLGLAEGQSAEFAVTTQKNVIIVSRQQYGKTREVARIIGKGKICVICKAHPLPNKLLINFLRNHQNILEFRLSFSKSESLADNEFLQALAGMPNLIRITLYELALRDKPIFGDMKLLKNVKELQLTSDVFPQAIVDAFSEYPNLGSIESLAFYQFGENMNQFQVDQIKKIKWAKKIRILLPNFFEKSEPIKALDKLGGVQVVGGYKAHDFFPL